MSFLYSTYTNKLFRTLIFPIMTLIDLHTFKLYQQLMTYFDESVVYYVIHNFKNCDTKIYKFEWIPLSFVVKKNGYGVSWTSNTLYTDSHLFEYCIIYNKKFKKLITNKLYEKPNTYEYKAFDFLSIKCKNKYISMNRYLTNCTCYARYLSLVFNNCVSDIDYINDNLYEIDLKQDEEVPLTNI
jgi:hypothetical protein